MALGLPHSCSVNSQLIPSSYESGVLPASSEGLLMRGWHYLGKKGVKWANFHVQTQSKPQDYGIKKVEGKGLIVS